MSRDEEILDNLYYLTIDGEADAVRQFTREGIERGMAPMVLLFDSLIPALEEVGRLFEAGEYFVPEMLIAAKAMQGAMDILKPLLLSNPEIQVGTYVMGTVKGDIHDIGKNLCNIMLESSGFKVIDLGVDCPPQRYIEAVVEHKAEIVGMSAFLTTTMPMFKKNIEAFIEAGLRDRVKIMVGGAPVSQEYCDVVGADGYAPDAGACVRLAKELLAQLKTTRLA